MKEITVNVYTKVIAGKERPVVTSRQIAERFDKRHCNVLRAIELLEIPQEFRRLNFEESSYANAQNKIQPEFLVTEEGFFLLAMGFNGKEAMQWKLRFIEAFKTAREALLLGPSTTTKGVKLADSATVGYRDAEDLLGLEFGQLGNLLCRAGICARDTRTRRLCALDEPEIEGLVEASEYIGRGGELVYGVRVTGRGLAWASMQVRNQVA